MTRVKSDTPFIIGFIVFILTISIWAISVNTSRNANFEARVKEGKYLEAGCRQRFFPDGNVYYYCPFNDMEYKPK